MKRYRGLSIIDRDKKGIIPADYATINPTGRTRRIAPCNDSRD
ncbi:MAG: hypothetical protein ABIJ52_13250 [Pseudomonadota bacterium]